MVRINAKFQGVCGNTGAPIKKGELCYYDRFQKKVFTLASVDQAPTSDADREAKATAGMVQAQEDAMYNDRFLF